MSSKDPNKTDDPGVLWTPDEEKILKANMETYPADKFTELKRYTLLLTNLPHKRLRDVATKVKYDEYVKDHPHITYQEFCKDKNLIRPQRNISIAKGHSQSSEDNSEVEGSSIKAVGKRSPGTTPMIMEGQHCDSIDGNVSDSMQIEEMMPKPIGDITDQLPPTMGTQQGKTKKRAKTTRKKTKSKAGSVQQPTTQNPDVSPQEQMMPVEEKQELEYQTQQELLQEGENILFQLQQNENVLSMDLIQRFHDYCFNIVQITDNYVLPMQLPTLVNCPYPPQIIQQFEQDPNLFWLMYSQAYACNQYFNVPSQINPIGNANAGTGSQMNATGQPQNPTQKSNP